jgi:hypothetical protein
MTKRRLSKHVESWRHLLAPDECLSRFKNRLVAKLATWHAKVQNSRQVEDCFAFLCGHPVPKGDLDQVIRDLNQGFAENIICKAIEGAKGIAEVCFVIECLYLATKECNKKSLAPLERLAGEAIAASPGIAITLGGQGEKFMVRPAGDPMLDKAVVDDVLLSLSRQPSVSKHFQEALRICASGETARFRNALDNLRFGLEALLKETLKNAKSLENQKPILLPWLKAQGLHQQVVNMYDFLLFGPYTIYQNDAVKHTERFSPIEVEFMIYLTGTFMRLLLDLESKTPNPTSASQNKSSAQ